MTDGWITRRPVPVDHGGPVDVRFEPFDEHWTHASPLERFELMAGRYPDKVAVDDGVTRLTYQQVLRKARALATRIDAEAPAGRPVAAVFRYTALFPVALLASFAAGRPLIPVDATHPQDRQQAILRNSGAGALLLQGGVQIETELPDLPRIEASLEGLGEAGGDAWPPGRLDMNAVGGVVYTSGSTGRPKGLAWSLAGFMPTIAELSNTNHVNPDDRIIALGSLSSAGLGDALVALLNGATLRVVEIVQAGVGELLRIMGEERVTILSFVPPILRSVLQMEGAPEAFRHLRILDLYGDATLASDVAYFRTKLPEGCHIRVVLGSMESGQIFHWFVRPDFDEPALALPCGYLAANKAVAVLDGDGRPVAVGEEGEVVIRSRQMALGAWQDGRLTPGPFLADPDDPQARIYAMGDLVRMRPDGMAEFVGRRDRQVKIRGFRADLGEVEAALRQHPEVADVAVVAVREAEDTAIVAYCTFRHPSAPPGAAELRRTVVAETAEHMAPSRIFALEAIPRLPNYKPDLVRLAERAQLDLDRPEALDGDAGGDIDPAVLDAVERAWAATLKERAQPGLGWESSGGDSLEELHLMHRIEEALGCELPPLLEPQFTSLDLARAVAGALETPQPAFEDLAADA